MRPELLTFLRCPACGGRLQPRPFRAGAHGDEVEEGLLTCEQCTHPYPVTDGIPRLLPDAFTTHPRFTRTFRAELRAAGVRMPGGETVRRFRKLHGLTARAFGYEWNAYRTTPWEEDVITFFWLTGADPEIYRKLSIRDVFTHVPTDADLARIDPSRLRSATVLDVGCGMGKYLAVVAEHARQVIGLDLSNALTRARALLRHRPNVHLVQGNILAAPLSANSVDFAYSVGVLHHTPDAPAAFARTASLVKPGGRLGIWVYPSELDQSAYARRVHWIQDELLRPITCRMPPRLMRWLVADPLGRLTFVRDRYAARHAATGSRLARWAAMWAGALAVGAHRDPEIAAFLNFDWYSPQYRSYHGEDEVRRWYDTAGFEDVTQLPQRVSAVGVKRTMARTPPSARSPRAR
jgi:SAM-dependent methyltransferase/uncharacterized protein YbaR (Trm112 family)